jgi:hypothetical protein
MYIVSAFDKDLAVGVFTKESKMRESQGLISCDRTWKNAQLTWIAANDERIFSVFGMQFE